MRGVKRLMLCIEGNIGIGKTTVFNHLQHHYASDASVTFVNEPVDEWEQHGFLGDMYAGRLHPGAFQQMILSSLAATVARAVAAPNVQVVISERSIWSNYNVFARIALNTRNDSNEWTTAILIVMIATALLLNVWCALAIFATCTLLGRAKQRFTRDMDMYKYTFVNAERIIPDDIQVFVIYLDAPIDIVMSRQRRRGRASEGVITEDYFNRLAFLHTAWINTLPTDSYTVIDASRSERVVFEEVIAYIAALVDSTRE